MNGDLSIGSINGGGVSSYNLIINPEFTINQRGAASRTATSSAYNYDRWYYDGTYLYQGIENLSLRNGTYCLSWSGASTAAYSLNSSSSSSQGGESYTAVTNGGTFTLSGLGSETLWVRFASDLTNLSQVCLRKGTSPLTFEHRNYGEELALCQRYYWKSTNTSISSVWGTYYVATAGRVWTKFPTPMRAVPTISTSSLAFDMIGYGGVVATSISNFVTDNEYSSFDGIGLPSDTMGRPLSYIGTISADAEL